MFASANVHSNVNWRIKKTPEMVCFPVERALLREGYETLRAYVLTPFKTPLRPIGLDLWNKKGFLAWSTTVFSPEPEPAQALPIPGNPDMPNIPAGLLIPIANILNDWSDHYASTYGTWENQT